MGERETHKTRMGERETHTSEHAEVLGNVHQSSGPPSKLSKQNHVSHRTEVKRVKCWSEDLGLAFFHMVQI